MRTKRVSVCVWWQNKAGWNLLAGRVSAQTRWNEIKKNVVEGDEAVDDVSGLLTQAVAGEVIRRHRWDAGGE